MTDPWPDVRELIRQSRPIPDSIALPLLTDAVALLAIVKDASVDLVMMETLHREAGEALLADRVYAVRMKLAALPEHLK